MIRGDVMETRVKIPVEIEASLPWACRKEPRRTPGVRHRILAGGGDKSAEDWTNVMGLCRQGVAAGPPVYAGLSNLQIKYCK